MTTTFSLVFAHLPPYPGDLILRLMQTFQAGIRADKVSCGIGVYFDHPGRLPILPSARRAESAGSANHDPRPYRPIERAAAYHGAVRKLLLGDQHEAVAGGGAGRRQARVARATAAVTE